MMLAEISTTMATQLGDLWDIVTWLFGKIPDVVTIIMTTFPLNLGFAVSVLGLVVAVIRGARRAVRH